jgi:hypothetical protein
MKFIFIRRSVFGDVRVGQWWRKETHLSPLLKRLISLNLLTVLNTVVKTNLMTKYPSWQDHGAERTQAEDDLGSGIL